MNVYVSWENLRFEVPDPDDKNATKVILDNLNGHVLPGELVAVIGPSGSGKSSFLNCIAGRNVNGVTGDLLFNGVPRPSNFARFTGYVVQDDLYLASLTVKETLTFAANLKLPTSMPKVDRQLRVRSILEELDLGLYIVQVYYYYILSFKIQTLNFSENSCCYSFFFYFLFFLFFVSVMHVT